MQMPNQFKLKLHMEDNRKWSKTKTQISNRDYLTIALTESTIMSILVIVNWAHRQKKFYQP